MALTIRDYMAWVGRSPEQQRYFDASGNVSSNYSSVPSQQNPTPIYTFTSKAPKKGGGFTYGTPINVYKKDTPVAATTAAETKTEPTVEQAAPPVINNVYQDRIKDLEATNAARTHRFSTEFGQSKERFGHKDYEEALKSGGSNTDIFNFLDKNQSLLAGGNVAGQAGGLYETLKIKAAEETAAKETAAKPDFGAQLAEMQSQQTAYLNDLQIQQNQRLDQMAAEQKAAAEALALGQRTSLQNQARAGQVGALQIGGAYETPRAGGTQGFKRRKLQINPVTTNALSGILGGTSAATQTNVLNV
jgi:hypothetical protein